MKRFPVGFVSAKNWINVQTPWDFQDQSRLIETRPYFINNWQNFDGF